MPEQRQTAKVIKDYLLLNIFYCNLFIGLSIAYKFILLKKLKARGKPFYIITIEKEKMKKKREE